MKTLVEEDLPMQVDCVSWRSSSSSTKQQQQLLLAVGAYQLDPQDSSKRLGRIYILKLTPEIPGGFTSVHEQQTKGVLHLAFDVDDHLAVATSNSVVLFSVEEDGKLVKKSEVVLQSMALFLQWVRKPEAEEGVGQQQQQRQLAVSDSNGFVYLFDVGAKGALSVKHKVKLHLELTWVLHVVVALNDSAASVLISGCDEGKLVAVGVNNLHAPPTARTTMTFQGGGVTSINSHNNIVAVGGYDEILRLYDLEPPPTPTSPPTLTPLSATPLGGAVWRTKFIPRRNNRLLMAVACGRNGLKLIGLEKEGREVEELFHFPKYNSFLCYGLDVVPIQEEEEEEEELTIATCYFDNHVVHVFTIPMPT